jgi:cyanophycinase
MTRPRGRLVPIGGAEAKGENLNPESRSDRRATFFRHGILKTITDLLPAGSESRIEIMTAACSDPANAFIDYETALTKLGFTEVGHLGACTRAEAADVSLLQRVSECHLLLMAGGDQLRLSSTLSGTSMLAIMKERYEDGNILIAGTSAGAMVMGHTMIAEGSAKEAHIKGALMMAPALGLFPEAVVDTHFNQRGRFNRLSQVVAASPGILGIGCDEDTGAILTEGHLLEVIGSGSVTIVDGLNIGYNNIGDISTETPLSVEGLRVHLLARGDCFDLDTRGVVSKKAREAEVA